MTDESDPIPRVSDVEKAWPWRFILVGMAIPILFLASWHIVSYVGQFRYKPWTTMPAVLVYLTAAQLSFILYSIYVFRKRGFRPLSFPKSVSRALKELGSSFIYFLLIGLFVGLAIKAMEELLGAEASDPLNN